MRSGVKLVPCSIQSNPASMMSPRASVPKTTRGDPAPAAEPLPPRPPGWCGPIAAVRGSPIVAVDPVADDLDSTSVAVRRLPCHPAGRSDGSTRSTLYPRIYRLGRAMWAPDRMNLGHSGSSSSGCVSSGEPTRGSAGPWFRVGVRRLPGLLDGDVEPRAIPT